MNEELFEAIRKLRDYGCAVVVFTPEELEEAMPDRVEDRLIELGWEVIHDLKSYERDA